MRNIVIQQSWPKIELLFQEFELLFPEETAVILIFRSSDLLRHCAHLSLLNTVWFPAIPGERSLKGGFFFGLCSVMRFADGCCRDVAIKNSLKLNSEVKTCGSPSFTAATTHVYQRTNGNARADHVTLVLHQTERVACGLCALLSVNSQRLCLEGSTVLEPRNSTTSCDNSSDNKTTNLKGVRVKKGVTYIEMWLYLLSFLKNKTLNEAMKVTLLVAIFSNKVVGYFNMQTVDFLKRCLNCQPRLLQLAGYFCRVITSKSYWFSLRMTLRMQGGKKKTGAPRHVTSITNKAAPLVMQARHEKGRGEMEKKKLICTHCHGHERGCEGDGGRWC